MECGMPKSNDGRIGIVQVEFRDNILPEKVQRGPCSTGVGLIVSASIQTVSRTDVRKKSCQDGFTTWVAERT
jgi:hypothetical protein